MARTPLLTRMQQLFRDFESADASGKSVAEVRAARHPRRRDFLKSAAGAIAVAAHAAPRPAPRIAIIGAGIGGLNAALTLHDAGFACTVYEASTRVGGRMHSDTTSWLNGQVSEHCGELIDSGHETVLALARRFHIPVVDILAAEPPHSTDTYYFGGKYYPASQADQDFKPLYHALQQDIKAAGYPTLYNSYTKAGFQLDHMSAQDWIDSHVAGGRSSAMGELLDVAYNIEYGAATSEQSALNLIYLLGFQPKPNGFQVFGESDEHFHLKGGNESLPRAIAAALPAGSIQLGAALRAIARESNGTYRLNFQKGPDVTADHVILALPFSVLRTLQYSQAGFSDLKAIAIQQLGYGSNAKLQLQFDARPWNKNGPWGVSTGGSYADTGYQSSWDVTRGQSGATGILVDYLGSAGAALTGNPQNPQVVAQYAAAFLHQLEPVFPGITAHWNGRATLDTPLFNPFALGSYSYWKVGQYTLFSGIEAQRSNNCHFAGEHCSTDFQGFMEGGAAEGARAAGEIIQDYK